MANAVATTEGKKSVLIAMADRYGMEPNAFELTVRATCMRPDKNGKVPNREEFAAFLLVAKEYKLNPLTKEIYAFTQKGGGIVPIVSIDGWVNLINSHPAMDGMEFEEHHDDKGELVSTTCRIYRKDRSKPIVVTEHLSECRRDTDPWKMKHRMLRHKSLVQCGRYAFGFSGIYDEDEGAVVAASGPTEEQVAKTVARTAEAPDPDADETADALREAGKDVEDADVVEDDAPDPDEATETVDQETGEVTETAKEAADAEFNDIEQYFADLMDALDAADDEASVEEVYSNADPLARFEGQQMLQVRAQNLRSRRLIHLKKKKK